MAKQKKSKRKLYGAGLEWSKELSNDIIQNIDNITLIELIPENFFDGHHEEFLQALNAANTPVIIHGVELSLGSAEALKRKHLDQMLEVADRVNTVAFTDHICMTEIDGIDVGQLTTLPFCQEVIDRIASKIEIIKKDIKVPIALENIANQFYYPKTQYTEVQFINRLMRDADIELILDLHNLYANAENFAFNAHAWLDELDMEKVFGIHLAGGYRDEDNFLEDGHNSAVPAEVWQLYRYVCERYTPPTTIVERTSNYPGIEPMLDEVEKAASILENRSSYRMGSTRRIVEAVI